VHAKTSCAGLIYHTHQHLPPVTAKHWVVRFQKIVWATDRWLWTERLWEKERLETRGKYRENVNKWSRINARRCRWADWCNNSSRVFVGCWVTAGVAAEFEPMSVAGTVKVTNELYQRWVFIVIPVVGYRAGLLQAAGDKPLKNVCQVWRQQNVPKGVH